MRQSVVKDDDFQSQANIEVGESLAHGLGVRLRTRREELGYSIQDVAELTKIQTAFITAIEEEHFDKLPGKVYVVGFLKTYARALDLSETIVEDYFEQSKAELSQDKQSYKMYLPRENKSFLTMKVIIWALFLFLMGMALVYYTDKTSDYDGNTPQETFSIQSTPESAVHVDEEQIDKLLDVEDTILIQDDLDLNLSDDEDSSKDFDTDHIDVE